MKNILGKYQPENTIIHRLDPRLKLIGLIIFIVSVFLPYGQTTSLVSREYMTMLILLVSLLFLIIVSFVAKVSLLTVFNQLKLLWFMILFLLIFNVFFPTRITSNSEVAFNIGNVKIYYYTIVNISYILLRLILVMFASLIYSVTTKPTEITTGLEFVFSPLKLIKVPVNKFAMTLSLALRFVPSLFETANRIIKAQSSRGVDFNHGKIKEKMKAITTLIIPLFITSFLTSSSLADSLEARGYNPSKKRTKYKNKKWSKTDTIFSIILGLFLSIIVVESVFKFDLFVFLGVRLPVLR